MTPRTSQLATPREAHRWPAGVAAVVAALLLAQVHPAQATAPPTGGRLVEGLACVSDPHQTYTLYLPSSYTPERRWPALLVLDPRGRSVLAAELFRAAAEENGWIILSSNDTRSDGPMEPNIKALNALWPEVHDRYATDPRRIYAAGFSGGALVAWMLAGKTEGLAGVIVAGAPMIEGFLGEQPSFASFGTVGDADFNYSAMHEIDSVFERRGVPHRLEVFAGTHSWMPEPLAREAVTWMELQAMRAGLAPRDPALIERAWSADCAAARGLEDEGRALEAAERWQAIAATFDRLRDVSVARASAARLESSPKARAARRERRSADQWAERRTRSAMAELFALVQDEAPMPAPRLIARLGIGELQQAAAGKGYRATAARRVLETIFTQASFYLMRELFAAGRWAEAVAGLTVAGTIHPDRWPVWYNLACAHARAGDGDRAVEALERAVESGFSDPGQALADPDLQSLRALGPFRALLDRLGGVRPDRAPD